MIEAAIPTVGVDVEAHDPRVTQPRSDLLHTIESLRGIYACQCRKVIRPTVDQLLGLGPATRDIHESVSRIQKLWQWADVVRADDHP